MMRSIMVVERREIRPPPPFALHNLSLRIIGQGCQDVKLQLAGWRHAVDALAEADERHTEALQFVNQRHQMTEIAPEPVKPPADDDIQLATFGVSQHLVKRRSPVLRS